MSNGEARAPVVTPLLSPNHPKGGASIPCFELVLKAVGSGGGKGAMPPGVSRGERTQKKPKEKKRGKH